jgi:hypothetical protein
MILTQSASEGVQALPRWRFGLVWNHFLPRAVYAQKYAQKDRLCASPKIPAELDASEIWTRGCGDFSCTCAARGMSFENTGPGGASLGAAESSSQRGRSVATSRGVKNYAQKRNERTLMRCRVPPKNEKSPSQAVDFHRAQRQNCAGETRRPRRVSSPPSPIPVFEPCGSKLEQANEVTSSTRAAGREAIARSRFS